jgi:hypothetical protein
VRLLILFIIFGCSSVVKKNSYFVVKTHNKTFKCKEFYHGTYGAAAKDCEDLLTGKKIDLIANPYNVSEIQ